MSFIGIEAGGTKFVCAIGDGNAELRNVEVFPTVSPVITLPKVFNYILEQAKQESIEAIGMASFGPLQLNTQSHQYGYVLNSPKSEWRYFNLLKAFKENFNYPIAFNTDVNAAALAELKLGAGQNLKHLLYVTVGSGIGCGAIVNGEVLLGALHPEGGHLFIPQDKEIDDFAGVCPYHQNCLEGLASGTAIAARWAVNAALDLPADHEAWDLEAHYLSLACANYSLALSPQKIILGGGVMQQELLFEKIHQRFESVVNGYLKQAHDDAANYIVPAQLGQKAGVTGAILLAQELVKQSQLNQQGALYHRPWGSYKVLSQEDGFQIKTLTVQPNGQLSLQKHLHRSEHWVVLEGTPTITIDKETKKYGEMDMVYIPQGAVHRIENLSKELVRIIEVQSGSYLGEDDIIRLEDVYGRETV